MASWPGAGIAPRATTAAPPRPGGARASPRGGPPAGAGRAGEIPPTRAAGLSRLGIAREVGAIYDRDVPVDLPAIAAESGTPTAEPVSGELLDEGLGDR